MSLSHFGQSYKKSIIMMEQQGATINMGRSLDHNQTGYSWLLELVKVRQYLYMTSSKMAQIKSARYRNMLKTYIYIRNLKYNFTSE